MRTDPGAVSSFARRRLLGVIIAIFAAVAFALSNAAASVAYHGGSNPMSVAAFRFLLPTVLLFGWMRSSKVPFLLSGRNAWISLALGCLTALYNLALLSAVHRLPLAHAILIFYLFPFLTAFILALFGWERLSWQSLLSAGLAFAGLALALRLRRSVDINLDGLALAFAAALGIAIVIVVSSRVFKGGDARPLTLNMAVVSALLLAVLCATRGELRFPDTVPGWIGFAGTAALYGFALIAFYIAVSMIGPVRASLLSFIEPVIAAGLGVILLGEPLTGLQIAGVALVIIALIGATAPQLAATKK
jgi:drug/metabolite transporter (DMT)-like permease